MKYCPQCATLLSSCLIAGAQRHACQQCHFIHWTNPVPTVAGLVEYEGKILLVHNTKLPSGGLSLITGYLECGETPEQGIVREIQEGLGLDASIKGFIGHYSFFQLNALILAFHIEAEGTLTPKGKITQVHPIHQEMLHHQTFPDTPFATHVVRDWYQQHTWRRVA